jgi:hypothetical protein
MRGAKEAFVVADKLKDRPLDTHEVFLASLESCEQEVAAWTDSAIDSFIGRDPRRLDYYNRAQWKLGHVDLDKCRVWSCMGGRLWAEGDVIAVAENFRLHERPDSRIWQMARFGDLFSARLPIIVFVGPSTLMVDDGSHRAVAMALAGLRSASAWIATLDA